MGRKNRYTSVLRPRQVGAPRGEQPVVLLYDIEDDRLRCRVSEICLDCGLERIQFSAFFGRVTRNCREQMALRILSEVEKQNARVRIMPLSEENLAEMWEYDYWRKDADRLGTGPEEGAPGGPQAEDFPRLRIVRAGED